MTTHTATPAELPLTPTPKLPVRHLLGLLGGLLLGLLAMLLYFQWRGHQQIESSAATTTRNLALALKSRVHGDLQRAANLLEYIPPALREQALARVRQLSRAEVLETYQTQRLTKRGAVLRVSITATALVNEAGRMYAIATNERAREWVNALPAGVAHDPSA